MRHDAEVIGKMKTKNRAESIRQIVVTAAIVLAACAILFGKQFALTVLANSTGKVTSTTANVRASASTSSEAIASLSKGDTVIVSGIISLREGVPVNIKDIRHGMNYEVD